MSHVSKSNSAVVTNLQAPLFRRLSVEEIETTMTESNKKCCINIALFFALLSMFVAVILTERSVPLVELFNQILVSPVVVKW